MGKVKKKLEMGKFKKTNQRWVKLKKLEMGKVTKKTRDG